MISRVIWRHHFSLVGKMPAVVMQFVSHPRPGSDLATILQLAKDGATLWRKHGASLKLGARLIPPAPGLPRYGHFIPPRDGAEAPPDPDPLRRRTVPPAPPACHPDAASSPTTASRAHPASSTTNSDAHRGGRRRSDPVPAQRVRRRARNARLFARPPHSAIEHQCRDRFFERS